MRSKILSPITPEGLSSPHSIRELSNIPRDIREQISNFMQYPGTNPFSAKETKTTLHQAQYPGANHHSTQQHPGITQYFIPHLGQYQFGRTTHYTGAAKFPGPPLYTPYLGTAQYPETSEQFVGRMTCNTGSQFQQTATQFSDGMECARENPSGQLLGNISASIIGNLKSKVFRNTSAQPQKFNSYQATKRGRKPTRGSTKREFVISDLFIY